jgi:hypothetical protein
MTQPVPWNVALILPAEAEIALLADLSRRRDAKIIGVIDPTGNAVGTTIAEVMGIPIFVGPDAPALKGADYWVYPPGQPDALPLVAAAARLGYAPLPTSEFLRLLAPPPLTAIVARPAPRHFERLERETESVHRTLSRIEEALHRESLLRWLLALATRAVGATAGSIMLYDEKARQLYIACAYGLSEGTLHATRQTLGHGIAGRVAEQLRAELVLSRPATDTPRDRPDIAAAISAPLVHEGRLLGVINVSVGAGDHRLGEDDLATIDRLAGRLGLILNRFLGLQRAREGESFRETDRQLQEIMQPPLPLAGILTGWVDALARRLGASQLALALICEDGTLLAAENRPDGNPRCEHRPLDDPAWNEVLQTGRPLVVRELSAAERPAGGRWTLFCLPVGTPPQAILAAGFPTAVEAHRFHDVSGEVVYLLEKRLPELVSRFTQRDRLERFAALTAALTEIAAADPDSQPFGASPLDLLADAARRLTGADEAHVVSGFDDLGAPRVPPGHTPPASPWFADAARLLAEARHGGWRTTVLSDTPEPRLHETTLLAVAAGPEEGAPGLLLSGKQRLHPLDGAVFTEFDAELAGRLARLLPTLLREREPAPRPAVLQIVADDDAPAPPAASTTTATGSDIACQREELLVEILRREMDRCDRYHGAFSLTALRATGASPWDEAAAAAVAGRLAGVVRSSDFVSSLADGTLVVLAPEENNLVSHFERRLAAMVRDLMDDPTLPLTVGHVLYPGHHDEPRTVLAAAISALSHVK